MGSCIQGTRIRADTGICFVLKKQQSPFGGGLDNYAFVSSRSSCSLFATWGGIKIQEEHLLYVIRIIILLKLCDKGSQPVGFALEAVKEFLQSRLNLPRVK